MNKFLIFLCLVGFFFCAVSSTLLSSAMDKAVDGAVTVATQEETATDIYTKMGEQSAAQSNISFMMFGMLLVLVILGSAAFYFLRLNYASEFYKQKRMLLKEEKKGGRFQSRPAISAPSRQSWELPPARVVEQLPAWIESE